MVRVEGHRSGARWARRALILAAIALPLVSGGCSRLRDHRGYIVDQALVDAIQPGVDNQISVERTLGKPTFVSQFGQPVWYYVSQDTRQLAFARPRTTEQLVMAVRFDPVGNVARVDRTGMELVANISPDGSSTPTLGRERGFFEDLFGNIGSVGAPGLGTPGTGGGPGT